MSNGIQQLEQRWQRQWEQEELYKIPDQAEGKENFYHLVMFPYPSGDLHIGHWYHYAPADVVARFRRMQGYNVTSPIGFDAFGLPAENAALARDIHPREWTEKNIERMRKQVRSMGTMFDWSREVVTADPAFYRWTQWLFLQLFHTDFAERREVPVNWCPSCKTVLANEQVVDGHCERCDTAVEQREMKQWVFRITDYAQRLLDDLETIDWPQRTKTAQRNWIGKSEGVVARFDVKGSSIGVFTTRADTLWGATYLVIAPEYAERLRSKLKIPNSKEVEEYIRRARHKTERERLAEAKEKTGVDTGLKATNPVNGEEIPVWVADYVLASYGTGAIMAVPAHDERDYAFSQKFGLPIRRVISSGNLKETTPGVGEDPPETGDGKTPGIENSDAYTGEGTLIDSGDFTGTSSQDARGKIIDWLEEQNMGERSVQWRLRDWIVSRQRYWGCPIPMIHCPQCGTVPVPEEDLPVELPDLDDFKPREDGRSPLARARGWMQVSCPTCGTDAERETDTMDTFVDSSWYFIRYTDPQNDHAYADMSAMEAWLPVDLYIGGAEHSVMHLLYARFISKVLYDQKLLPVEEPFAALRHQGMILGEGGQKMSKSRGNVVDPDNVVAEHGADVVRLHMCFMGPYDQGGLWDLHALKGVGRFLDRINTLIVQGIDTNDDHDNDVIERAIHRALRKVTDDIPRLRFNTAIAAMMEMLNAIEKSRSMANREQAEMIVRMLAPFAPHRAEEWWRETIGNKGSVHLQPWPVYNPALLEEKEIEIPVQVNGKVRATVVVPAGAPDNAVQETALAEEAVCSAIGDRVVQRVVVVSGKIVNIVVE